MQKRQLGKTELELSIMGMGGFHLVETPQADVGIILNTYLDRGGNYIETAADYGDGLSEKKIAHAVSNRRQDYFLASKCSRRTKKEAMESIERSLKNLRTDYLDIIFMHGVQSIAEAKQIFAPGGAIEAVVQCQQEKKVRYIGITGHGQPDALIYAIRHHHYDLLMTGFNYFDRFNFPKTEQILIKECLEKDVGLLGMKALADGYLYSSVESGIRYTLSLPISSLILGVNTLEYLERDLAVIENFEPMTEEEQEELFSKAPELGNYVCRLCGDCDTAEFRPSQIFLMEGEYDRQMDDGTVPGPAQYALRERLKHWFAQTDSARERYQHYPRKVDPNADYNHLNEKCPYGINIDRKLKLAHSKLSKGDVIF
ncbi:aldo/keto reductase [candidate division KSB1 bacterium]|nr:aldo/keto reductase [candidate division KSB1 bacterium]